MDESRLKADTSSSPTIGTLVALSPEEVVIKPKQLEKPAAVDMRIHFPRTEFVIRPLNGANL